MVFLWLFIMAFSECLYIERFLRYQKAYVFLFFQQKLLETFLLVNFMQENVSG